MRASSLVWAMTESWELREELQRNVDRQSWIKKLSSEEGDQSKVKQTNYVQKDKRPSW